MGLFWIRPDLFIALDSKNREFLSVPENLSETVSQLVKPLRYPPNGEKYLEICKESKIAIENNNFEFTTFPELSEYAYSFENPTEEEGTGGVGDNGIRTRRYWVYSPGHQANAWEEFYKEGDYTYAFSSIRSEYIECVFSDGSVMKIRDALEKGLVSVSDLKTYDIMYWIIDSDRNYISSMDEPEITELKSEMKFFIYDIPFIFYIKKESDAKQEAKPMPPQTKTVAVTERKQSGKCLSYIEDVQNKINFHIMSYPCQHSELPGIEIAKEKNRILLKNISCETYICYII